MATEIKTFKERPECAIPGCTNEAFIYVAGQWICGLCCKKWYDSQREKEKEANNEMFKDIVEATKNGKM